MSIVAVIGLKGGVGKTTLSVQLAAERANQGRRLLLLDTDPQRTSENSISNRPEDLPPISCLHFNTAKNLRQQSPLLFPQFDDTIIDLAGSDGQMLRAALLLAETILVPCAPRAYEIWALDDIISLIVEANGLREDIRNPPLKVIAAMNLAGPTQRRIDDAIKRAGGVAGATSMVTANNGDACEIYFAATSVRRREIISEASSFGISVRNASGGARNAPAIAEIAALTDEVFSL